MELSHLIAKGYKVVTSCKTTAQLQNAERYIRLLVIASRRHYVQVRGEHPVDAWGMSKELEGIFKSHISAQKSRLTL